MWIFALIIFSFSKQLLSLSSGRIMTSVEYFLPCITNITSNYNNDAGTDFLLLSEELRYPVPSDEIVRGIHHSVVIQREQQFKGYFGFFLLFPTKEKSYESLLKIIRLSAYNKFLVVWPHETTNAEIKLNALINQFWSFRLLNVVILMRTSTTAICIYGYNPFMRLHCHEPRLVRLDVWSIPQKKFIYNNNLYANYGSKFFNLNGCPLICLARLRPPDAIVRQVGAEWVFDGVGGQLMNVLRNRFNFTSIIEMPKLDVPADKYGYDISNGIPELFTAQLVNQSIDLAFGIFSHTAYFRESTELPSFAVSECIGFAVPAHLGTVIPTWMYYTGEFNIQVWILILSVYLASILLIYLCSRVSHQPFPPAFHQPTFVAFYTLAIFLGRPTNSNIVFTTRLRIIITMISLFSIIISSAYKSSMESLQAVPWQRENVKTFQEILDANLQIKSSPQFKNLLTLVSKGNRTFEELSAKFHAHRGFFGELIHRMQQKRDIAIFNSERLLQFYISNELNKTGRNDIYIVPECIVHAHSSPFLLKKGSPFSHAINYMNLVAVEAGLTQYWFKYSSPKKTLSPFSDGIRSLGMDKLMFVFVILFIGLALSVLVFLVEVLWVRIHSMKFRSQYVRRRYNLTRKPRQRIQLE